MKSDSAKNSDIKTFPRLCAFAIAMGILEAIVVVYLRELYYPAGFRFPLKPMPEKILITEMLREGCTIAMLAALAASITKIFYLRLSYFLFTFGAWDIFYYAGLKALLDWPPDIMTWDILFLIPVTWAAPVLSPLIAAVTMIGLGILISFLYNKYRFIKSGLTAWAPMGLGAFIIFLTYIWDYSKIIVKGGFLSDFFNLPGNPAFQITVSSYAPEYYNWHLFALGEAIIISGAITLYRKTAAR